MRKPDRLVTVPGWLRVHPATKQDRINRYPGYAPGRAIEGGRRVSAPRKREGTAGGFLRKPPVGGYSTVTARSRRTKS